MSRTCLAIHWFISLPFGGMRTIGVTLGASEPDSAICFRLSMYWSASRRAGALIGACSDSNTTPSMFDPAIAIAVSTSTAAKPANAVLPCSSALMTPFSRGISAIVCSSVTSAAQARVDAARVALEDLLLVGGGKRERVDVALGVVVVVAGLRVDAPHRAHHLGGEQDVVDGDDLGQQIDAGLVVDAGVEVDVLQHVIAQQRALEVLGDAPIAAPVVGHRAAAVGDD